VSGPELDQVEDIVTGIPISDHDHGVNGIEWGDNGELYFQNGGNTNAGIPGKLSSREQQDEDWFSAATLVARGVNSPAYDGDITYDSSGFQTGGFSVEVFAYGMRNPFDLCLHSNGKLYGTGTVLNVNIFHA
jgi:glucose/arabinose dehydrogenase